MKKSLIITAAILSLSALSACQKDFESESQTGVKFVKKSFTATIVDIDAQTKAITDGIKTYWKAGDKISVSNSTAVKVLPEDGGILTAQSDGLTTTFSGTVAEGLEKYYAVYPYGSITCWNNSGNEKGANDITASLRGTSSNPQKFELVNTVGGVNYYIDPNCMYMYGETTGNNTVFAFKHALAYIKFTVPEGFVAKIKQVQIWDSTEKGGAAEHQTNQKISLLSSENWKVGSMGSKNTLYAKMSDGARFAPGVYYIAIIPKASYSGLNIKFANTDKSLSQIFFKAKGDGNYTGSLEAGKVYDLGTIPELVDIIGK